jgi:hypothetical protein
MVCSKCNNSGELKVFSTFQYYYCHSCKDEIGLSPSSPAPASSEARTKDYLQSIQYTGFVKNAPLPPDQWQPGDRVRIVPGLSRLWTTEGTLVSKGRDGTWVMQFDMTTTYGWRDREIQWLSRPTKQGSAPAQQMAFPAPWVTTT